MMTPPVLWTQFIGNGTGTAPLTLTMSNTVSSTSWPNSGQWMQLRLYTDSSGVGRDSYRDVVRRLDAGWTGELTLPDGAKLISEDGKYWIEEGDGKVRYRRTYERAFNRYINASDLLEEFIAFLGTLGVRQSEVLDIPLDCFIHWLIMRAAQQDGEPMPPGVLVREHPKLPAARLRCTRCGRFIRRGGLCSAHERHTLLGGSANEPVYRSHAAAHQ